MSISEFHNLKIMSTAWQGYSLQFQCPLIWSINQIKCYISYISPKMQFHQFQVSFAGKVLPGTMKLQELVSAKKEKDKTVIFLSSKPAEKFESYYMQRMENFCVAIDEEFQKLRPGVVESQLQGMPVLNRNFDSLVRLAAITFKWQGNGQQQQQQPAANGAGGAAAAAPAQPQRFENNDNDEGGIQLGTMTQIAILFFVVMTLWSQGSYIQIVCIGILLLLHEIVGKNRRRNRQAMANQPQPQQKPVRTPIQRKVRLVYVTLKEFLYCYFMSLFPNWNLQRDYLEKFKAQIEQDKKDTEEQEEPVVEKPKEEKGMEEVREEGIQEKMQ